MTKAIKLKIKAAGFGDTTDVEPTLTVNQLTEVIIHMGGYYEYGRYKITKNAGDDKPVIYLDVDKTLTDNGIEDGDTINFHDMGGGV